MDTPVPNKQQKRKRLQRLAIFAGVAVFIVLATAGLRYAMQARISRKNITIAQATHGPVQNTLTCKGQVIAGETIALTAPATALVQTIQVREGDRVQAGEMVMQLSGRRIKEALQENREKQMKQEALLRQHRLEAQGKLEELQMQKEVQSLKYQKARENFQTTRKLLQQGASSKYEMQEARLSMQIHGKELRLIRQKINNRKDKATARAEEMQHALNLLKQKAQQYRRQLQQTGIQASVKGIVAEITCTQGMQVTEGSVLARLASSENLLVQGRVPEYQAGKLKADGQVLLEKAEIRISGKIATIRPKVRQGMLEFLVQADAGKHPGWPLHTQVKLFIITQKKPQALRIPLPAYYDGTSQHNLWVVQHDEAVKRLVQTGISSYKHLEVKSGLQEGDSVIVSDMSAYTRQATIKLKP